MNNMKYLLQRVQGYFIDKLILVFGVSFCLAILNIDHHYHFLPIPSFLAEKFEQQAITRAFVTMTFGYPNIEDIILFAIYIVIAAHFFGTTYGMNKCGLSIEDSKTGNKPSIIKILFWYALAHISALIFGIGYLWALIDKNGRTLHDIIAGVKIVYGISTLELKRKCRSKPARSRRKDRGRRVCKSR